MKEREEAGVPAATDSRPAVEGLFIDLGERGPEDVARLKEGSGPMASEIHAAIDRWRENLGVDTARDVVPIVILYKRGDLRSQGDSK